MLANAFYRELPKAMECEWECGGPKKLTSISDQSKVQGDKNEEHRKKVEHPGNAR